MAGSKAVVRVPAFTLSKKGYFRSLEKGGTQSGLYLAGSCQHDKNKPLGARVGAGGQ